MKFGAVYMVKGVDVAQNKLRLLEHVKGDLTRKITEHIVFEYYAVKDNGNLRRIQEHEVLFFSAGQNMVVEVRCNILAYFTPQEFAEDARKFEYGGVI